MPTIKVTGMRCGHCTAAVVKALSAIDGVRDVNVDLATGEVRYTDSKQVSLEVIKETITKIGFEVG